MKRPSFKFLGDILEKKSGQDAIIQYVEANPDDDFVFEFPTPRKLGETIPDNNNKGCVAGSAILHEIQFLFDAKDKKLSFLDKKELNWKPTDIDFWILGMPYAKRRAPMRWNSYSDSVAYEFDIIHAKQKTPAELILAFDLPPTRAARDASALWISIQCLYSIITKKYPLSSNIEATAKKAESETPAAAFLFGRLEERIRKYKGRGFTPYYFESSEISPWLLSVFDYAKQHHAKEQTAAEKTDQQELIEKIDAMSIDE